VAKLRQIADKIANFSAKDSPRDIISSLKNINVNETFSWGVGQRTLLLLAVEGGHKRLVEALLEKGASVDNKIIDGESVLQAAARISSKEIFEILIKRSSVANKPNAIEALVNIAFESQNVEVYGYFESKRLVPENFKPITSGNLNKANDFLRDVTDPTKGSKNVLPFKTKASASADDASSSLSSNDTIDLTAKEIAPTVSLQRKGARKIELKASHSFDESSSVLLQRKDARKIDLKASHSSDDASSSVASDSVDDVVSLEAEEVSSVAGNKAWATGIENSRRIYTAATHEEVLASESTPRLWKSKATNSKLKGAHDSPSNHL
jgi:hypothetical protein